MLQRIFDTEKEAEMEILLKPRVGEHSRTRMLGKATVEDNFSLGSRKLEPGEYELKLIGPINFKYRDQYGKFRVLEEMHLDLGFWFIVSVNPDSSLEEEDDDDQPDELGYHIED
jgi:hypothetical protein